MKLNLFAKKRTTNDGKKTFYTYLSTVTRKDGTEIPVQVKFREACGQPRGEDCPLVIEVDKKACNLSTKEIITDKDTGEVKTTHRLWVSEWRLAGAYVDNSMDDIMD